MRLRFLEERVTLDRLGVEAEEVLLRRGRLGVDGLVFVVVLLVLLGEFPASSVGGSTKAIQLPSPSSRVARRAEGRFSQPCLNGEGGPSGKVTHSSRCCQLELWRSSILLTVSRLLRSRLDSAAWGGRMLGGAACAAVCGLDMGAVVVEDGWVNVANNGGEEAGM